MAEGDAAGERGGRRGLVRLVVLPMVAALLVISFQALRLPIKAPEADEFYYLTIARDLSLHGVVTDGPYKRALPDLPKDVLSTADERPEASPPGRFFGPTYPILIYVLSLADPQLRDAIRCHVKAFGQRGDHCPNTFRTLILANIGIATLSATTIFLIGWSLTRSMAVAWSMLLIALATGELGFYARTYLSETLTVASVLVFALFGVHAMRDFRRHDFALAGGALAVAALTRPAYVYLLYGLTVLLIALPLLAHRLAPRLRLAHGVIFAVAAAIVLAPWLARNVARFGDPALSKGYAEVILSQRLSYNRMSWGEWLVAWIYWLPDFGDGLARILFPKALYAKLGWSVPDSYYFEGGGGGTFWAKVLAEAGSRENALGHLVRHYLIGDAVKHVLVSLPLTMRGLGVAKYLSVVAVPLIWLAGRRMHARGALLPYLALALPLLAMSLLHGFISVNIVRYNVPIVALYAFVVASLGVELLEARRRPAPTAGQ